MPGCPDSPAPATAIIGLGNTILGDDGVGIHVARAVARRLPSHGYALVEAGVTGLRLLPLLEGWQRVIIIDAVLPSGAGAPCLGRLHRLTPDALASAVTLTSTHDLGLADALALGERLGMSLPREVTIFGVEVEDPFTFGEELSPELAACVEWVAAEIARECGGPPGEPRACGQEPEAPGRSG